MDEIDEIFYLEQNFVIERFLVGTISKVDFEIMEHRIRTGMPEPKWNVVVIYGL